MSEQERLLDDEELLRRDHLEGGAVRGSDGDGKP
jgi:hypothetical protein